MVSIMDIEKHDLNDILEVQKIRELIKGHRLCLDFFETMLKLINKNINNPGIYYECLSEVSSEAGEEIDDYEGESCESEDEIPLSDI
jgi:hypothetical protein